MRLIRRSMLTFGLTSTFFDLLTFAALLAMANGAEEIFRTGWFLESLLTELWILFVLRTYRPFYRSRPSRFLIWSAVATMLVGIALPLLPVARLFGFVPLPIPVFIAILVITMGYVAVSEATKRWFYRHLGGGLRYDR
jgi:Mg2+-importing ATPase